jgi:hypothetical protein
MSYIHQDKQKQRQTDNQNTDSFIDRQRDRKTIVKQTDIKVDRSIYIKNQIRRELIFYLQFFQKVNLSLDP